MADSPNWRKVRRDYEGRVLTIAALLAKHGISPNDLLRERTNGKWVTRPSVAEMAKAKAAGKMRCAAPVDPDPPQPLTLPVQKAKRITKPKPIAQRRAIVDRLTNAIDTKLKLLERRFEREMAGLDTARGKAISAADFERDTRNIGLLIKSLEQVTDYDQTRQLGARITGAAAKSASIAASALADEADRLRRELAERLQRLVDPAG